MKAPKPLRCAIYTRVSTDHGLDQEFNSLDNQREAAEAFIKSQAHEGWRCIPTAYDDGGSSGGSLERPAMQRMLDNIRASQIDVVVVYKVDRLTRSLADFAKLIETFDAHEVSFVSVTQAFNTTNSMGRLTLNVLLSFAQFEREVTAERIRDKIAASKRKGMRMGGPVPLGYGVENKRLVINPDEAERVQLIFRRYLELGCLSKLARDLRDRGIVTKLRGLSKGGTRGGIPFTKGPLAYLLKNRVYVGEIVHKTQHYPGEHEPILSRELFDAVQQKLAAGANVYRHTRINNASLLTGRIFDDRGNRMTPSTAKKGNVRYRYYISAPVLQGNKEQAGSVARVSAPDIEAVVVSAIRDRNQQRATPADQGIADTLLERELIENHVGRVKVCQGSVEIVLTTETYGPSESMVVPWSPPLSTRRREIILPSGKQCSNQRPIRADQRARLVAGIAKARGWLDELVSGSVTDTKQIAERESCSERSVRMTLGLAFLSPALVEAAINGQLPMGWGSSKLVDQPADWSGHIPAPAGIV